MKGAQVCGKPPRHCPGVNVAGRDYFVQLQQTPTRQVRFYGPYPSLMDGQPVVVLARALMAGDGTFGGVVIALVPLERLQGLVNTVRLGPAGATSLRLGSLAVVVRAPVLPASAAAASVGPASPELRSLVSTSPSGGIYRSTNPFDGLDRINALRHLQGWPLYVLVGDALDDFLVSWWRFAVATGVFLGIFGAVSVLLVRTAQQSAARHQRAEELYDQAPCGYHNQSADGTILRINDTELAWLGYSRDEVVGKRRIVDFLTDAGRAEYARLMPGFVQSGSILGLELDLVRRDGARMRVRMDANAVRDAAARFVMSRTVMFDVTEAHELRLRRQVLMDEQQAMIDNELIGMVRLRKQTMVFANRALHRIFAYDEGELDGQPIRRLYLDQGSYDAVGQDAHAQLQGSGKSRRQLQMRRKDGVPVWIDLYGTRLSGLSDDDTLWMMSDVTVMQEQQLQAHHLANHDALTGLPNRRLLGDRLVMALARAARSHHIVAVCAIDLDGFKPINDTFGHAAGDTVLRTLAGRIQGCLRAHDTVSRIGGDEFIVLLDDLDQSESHHLVIERLNQQIGVLVALDDGQDIQVTASVGVALYPTDGATPAELLLHADRAMYMAKRNGRDSDWHVDLP
jgi:diguanylate cyclase (GGDEF)-like protein/PAS domain S-box-containing protein